MKFLAALSFILLCSCSINYIEELNELKRPVTVVAVGDGGTLVSGSDGKLFLARYDTYLGGTLKYAKVGDIISK